MNANTRRMLQKRKQMLHDSRKQSSSIDEHEIREATSLKFSELLSAASTNPPKSTTTSIAKTIEVTLHNKYKAHTPEYKSSFRRLYVSLKNENLPFRAQLLNGDLDPKEFALKSADELKSAEMVSKDEKIKKEEMRMSVAEQFLPETVNQIKDGRDREKWGVSRSAAAIDD